MPSLLKHALAGATALCAVAGIASAERVELYAPNSNITLEGDLLSFDGKTYVLSTALGTFELQASAVDCRGDACPSVSLDLTSRIAVTDDASRDLANALVQGLATQYDLEAQFEEDGDKASIKLYDIDRKEQGVIDVASMTVEQARNALMNGEVDLLMTDTAFSLEEAEDIKTQFGLDFQSNANDRVAAIEAYAPLVSRRNSVKLMSLFDLADIISGRITNWSQLGGDDVPIRMILPSENNPEFAYMRDVLLTPYRIRLNADIERMDNPEEIARAVSQDPTAITFGSTTRAAVQPVAVQRSCGLLANTSSFQVQAEEYPFTRRLHVYGNSQRLSAGVSTLFDYSISPESGEYVTFARLFPPSIYAEPLSSQGSRVAGALTAATQLEEFVAIQDLVDQLADASRVSTAFRFVTGSARLDTKAGQDLDLIVDYLLEEGSAVKEVLLVGYTDNVGRQDMNVRLAETRAAFVRDALIQASAGRLDADLFKTYSYGPLAPVDCNDTVEGRASNRRVEVWVR